MTRQRLHPLRSLAIALALPAMPLFAEDTGGGAVVEPAPAPAPVPMPPPNEGVEPFEQPAPVVEVRPKTRRRALRDPERPRLVEDQALVIGVIGAGSDDRNDGALVLTRRDGQLIDGFGSVGFRRSEHTPHELMLRTATLTAGTDPITVREGRFLWDAALEQAAWRGPFTLYDVSAHGGWSVDRRTILGADVVASILHLGIERDEHVRSYAIGAALVGSPEVMPFRLTVDRVISYVDGQRFYATEARLRVPFLLENHLLVYLEGAHIHHGVDAVGRTVRVWEAFAGLGLVF